MTGKISNLDNLQHSPFDPKKMEQYAREMVERRMKKEEEEEKARREEEEKAKREAEKPEEQNIIIPTGSGIQTIPRQGMIYVPSVKLYFQPERTHEALNWFDTHEALNQEQLRMPTISEFIEFLKVLRGEDKYQKLYEDITKVKESWRAEWLDAYFPEINRKLSIQHHNQIKEGKIISGTLEELEDYLMEERTPGISLDDWIDNSTKQGLPRANAPEGKMCYWGPLKGYVARLDVDSASLYLNCFRAPASIMGVGVFGCVEEEKVIEDGVKDLRGLLLKPKI